MPPITTAIYASGNGRAPKPEQQLRRSDEHRPAAGNRAAFSGPSPMRHREAADALLVGAFTRLRIVVRTAAAVAVETPADLPIR
jgi:hypothetical protein